MKAGKGLSGSLKKALILAVCVLSLGADFYNPDFDDTNPPVYLSTVLEPEPPIARIEIKEVIPDSPAGIAGLLKGDQIVQVHGQELDHSARKLYQLLFELNQKQILKGLSVVVMRDFQKQTFLLGADNDPTSGMFGMKYRFVLKSGRELKHVQFVKKDVSAEGISHDAIYSFGEGVRQSVRAHVWGAQLLVMEFYIMNDSLDQTLVFDPKNIVVKDNYGEIQKALKTDAVVGKIYDVYKINEVLSKKLSARKKKAREVSSEINKLKMDLGSNELRQKELAPGQQIYGALFFPYHSWQHDFNVTSTVAGEKFVSRLKVDNPYRLLPEKPKNNNQNQQPYGGSYVSYRY